MIAPLTVLVVETERAFRQELSGWLVSLDGVRLAGLAETDPEGTVLARERQPDVVLVDVVLALAGGEQPVAPLHRRYPGSKILVMSHANQEPLVLEALSQGAAGFIVKEEATPEVILNALRTVCRGEAVLSPRVAGLILDQIVIPRTGAVGETCR